MNIFLLLAFAFATLAPIIGRLQRAPWEGFRARLASRALTFERGAITLADAEVNTQDDVDFAIINETRRKSWLLDQLTFDDCVNPSGGGSTLTYGYTRLVTPAGAAFRAFGSEYVAGKATRQRYTVDLKPLGGSFEVDRVLARLGQAATNEEAFQFEQLTESVRTKFQTEMINGDVAVDVNGFDGLDKSLAGTSTELIPDAAATAYANWTSATINTEMLAHDALDLLDEFVNLVNGGADAILGNEKSTARVRSIARRAGYYTRAEDALGRVVEKFGNAVIVDLGQNTDSSGPIIPIETRDPDGGGAGGSITGLTDIYAVKFGLDAFHAVSTVGELVNVYRPDYTTPGVVKKGEVEMGPLAGVLKATRGAAVLRNIKVQ